MRIIFMGTPDFAVETLKVLIGQRFNIVAVVTSTDKYGGRGGKKLLQSAVKKYALSQNIDILQPNNLKHEDFIENLKSYRADIQLVVAFRMLPRSVWDMPSLGTYNIHASLLPKYRGAAPINWAIINGEKETGVSSFKLKHEIDTGNVLLQEKTYIKEDETAGQLYNRLKIMSANLAIQTLKLIEKGEIDLKEQDGNLVIKAPKIYHHMCEINWRHDTQTVYNFIRGMSPYPTAWTTLDDLQFNIITATKAIELHDQPTGHIFYDKKSMKIATNDGWIYLDEVQLEGKKRMKISQFLNGYKPHSTSCPSPD